jgi:hypothetical protein
VSIDACKYIDACKGLRRLDGRSLSSGDVPRLRPEGITSFLESMPIWMNDKLVQRPALVARRAS